jgi:FtsH-binding integral membrane protein
MLNTNSVWSRTEAYPSDLISDRLYNLTIGVVLLWGFALNYAIVQSLDAVWLINTVPNWALLVGYFLSTIAGMVIYTSSDSPWVSFFGYNLIVVPIGVILTPLLYQFDALLIQRALTATGGVTVGMMMLSGAFPSFFLSIGRTLFLALLLGLISQLVMMFFFKGSYNPNAFDWGFIVIFSGYIGYDWARANAIPKTFDNAVDSAASLYLDIINLFIRIL